MTLLLPLLIGCPADPPPETDPPPGPLDTAPPLDTGLPEPPPAPLPAVLVEVGPARMCGDIGRDTRFYDEVHIGSAPEPIRRDWTASGLIVDDFDGDGQLDIVAPGRGAAELWTRNPEWTNRGSELLSAFDLSDAVGGSAADFDGDGDPDLFITRYGERNVLLRNDGGTFTDVTTEAGIPDTAYRTASASWGDIDRDGWLDLMVGNYGDVPPDAWSPEMVPGDPSQLLLNNGDGTFTDLSASLPQVLHDGYTFQTAFYDVDDDGYPELFAIQDFGWVRPSLLLWNRQGSFAPDDGSALFHPNFAGMGLGVADLNDDRVPDFAQSSYEELSLLLSQSTPFATQGLAWAEFSDAMGLEVDLDSRHQAFGWGTEFGDLDNDGDLDLVMGFGRWDEYSNYALQFDAVWVQEDGQFEPRSGSASYRADDEGATRGVLLVDLDGDGWLDIVKRILDEPITAHVSRCSPTRHWSRVVLRDPTVANSRAIGARVTLHAGPLVLTRWVQAGSSSMFSGGPPELHFGLSEELAIDRIEVTWPDGEHVVVHQTLPVDRSLELTRQ